jgi:hypothetical protein
LTLLDGPGPDLENTGLLPDLLFHLPHRSHWVDSKEKKKRKKEENLGFQGV